MILLKTFKVDEKKKIEIVWKIGFHISKLASVLLITINDNTSWGRIRMVLQVTSRRSSVREGSPGLGRTMKAPRLSLPLSVALSAAAAAAAAATATALFFLASLWPVQPT